MSELVLEGFAAEGGGAPLIDGDKTNAEITRDICRPFERKPTMLWWSALAASSTLLLIGFLATAYQIATGIGTWGLNKTVGWAFDITNFVFWVGIGHAGTLISAVLFLFRQRWRTSVNRSAEAMTLFAVMCAGIFPLIHMGRPWMAFWVLPYPNTRGSLWVNFRSPLLWDVFAISVYFTVSAVFWYLGLIPDLATVRDRAAGLRKKIFGIASFGWNGSVKTWNRYELVYLLLAGLATPLVLSVHSIVSFDFATSVLPGWHTTIFPPYFVAGAIFSGMSMVLTLMIIARKVVQLEDYITLRHIDAMAKLVLVTSCMVGLAYSTEFFTAFYGENRYEQFVFINRATGPFAFGYWTMVICNVVAPQLYWFRRVRRSLAAVFVISILVNVGMWFERFIIIVTSLHRDYIPSSWAMYRPTLIEIATLIGSFGLFFTAFLIFCRFLPMIAMAEVKGAVVETHDDGAPAPSPAAAVCGGVPRRYAIYFDDEERLKAATRNLQRHGYAIDDIRTPYAVHGLEKLAGLRHSRLGWVCAIGGFSAAGLALLFEVWTSAQSWALDVGGKPFASIPAFIPVTFEVGVLGAALSTAVALFVRSKLYPGAKVEALPRTTDDRFAIVVAANDAVFDLEALKAVYIDVAEVRA